MYHLFLKIGVTIASFQEEGKEPEDRDELNREHNGLASSEESSLSFLLFSVIYSIGSGRLS